MREELRVSKLTALSAARRKVDALWSFPFAMLALAGTCLIGPASATEWESSSDIAAAAVDFVRERYGRDDERLAPVAGHLDPRLRLAKCDRPLEAFVRRGTRVTSRTVVGVRCAGSRPWKVYVPVDVVVLESVLVTRRSLPKGHVVTAEDIVVERQDVSRLNGGYVSTLDELRGLRLKHQVMSGRVITPSMLAAEMIVRRGQSVTLVVRSDALNIRMAGKALSDGALNQRIRVENTASQRVVEGIVRSAETVEILVR